MNFGVEHLCTVMKIRGEALEILFSLSSRLQVVAEGGGGGGNKCHRLAFLSHAPPLFFEDLYGHVQETLLRVHCE